MTRVDLRGQRFGSMVVVSDMGMMEGVHYWLCRCSCGFAIPVRHGNLTSGNTHTCGCGANKNRELANRIHGHSTRRLGPTTTYNSWKCMIIRCTYKSHRQFKDYGGRGIRVCAQWRRFELFLADMGERPVGKTLDRWPDPDGNYKPGNCRWATRIQQRRNRRKS